MTNQEVLYSSNELAIFKTVFEDAISSLSPSMLASCNRLQVAQNILSRAAAGERDPIELGWNCVVGCLILHCWKL